MSNKKVKKVDPSPLSISEEEKLSAEKRKEQSQEALIYYQENKVPQTIQLVLNQMFLQKPKDVNGYISRFFSSRALTPSVHHFECTRTIDANCSPATKVSLFGTIKGECELIAESAVSDNFGSNDLVEESIKGSLTQSKSSITSSKHNLGESQGSIEKATPSLTDHHMSNREIIKRFNTSLEGKELVPLQECLELINVPAGPPPQPSMLLALSQSIILGLANSTGTPIYDIIAGIGVDGNPDKLAVPRPMFHMLNGTGGKCKLADFFIAISPNIATLDGLKHAQTFYDKLKQSVKLSCPLVSDGAVRYNIDKLEQGMELLAEAGKGLELSLGEDVFVFLNADAGVRWDPEKSKYEINSGQWKSSTELVELYNELIRNYPSAILGIFNAFHEGDTSGYSAINRTHPLKTLFLNSSDSIEKMQAELKEKKEQNESEEVGNPNSFVLSKRIELPLHSWIEDVKKTQLMKELGFALINNPRTEVCSSFNVDLVTGLGGSFILTGSPRDKGTSLYLSRILDIGEELRSKKRLKSNKRN